MPLAMTQEKYVGSRPANVLRRTPSGGLPVGSAPRKRDCCPMLVSRRTPPDARQSESQNAHRDRMISSREVSLPDSAYGRLLALRTGLRHFERWSEQQARSAGLTPARHQLLLAIRGHGDLRGPTIGELADHLLLKHHSAVGLVDRAATAGLVRRCRDEEDHRVVRLKLTDRGERSLENLSTLHLEELQRLAPQLSAISDGLEPVQSARAGGGSPPEQQ